MGKWKEETRRGEIVVATLNVGRFQLKVHRHIHYPENTWLLSCYGIFVLASEDLEEAKCQAVALVQAEFESTINELLKAD